MRASEKPRSARKVLGLALGALLLASALGTRPASAAVVERIVAVVGDRPILLSEVQTRSRPFLLRIAQSAQNPAQQAAAESDMRRELLVRMVDERLEEQSADKAKLTVTPEEIDGAIANVAAQSRITPKEVYAEARKSLGLTDQEYREEIRRQLLQGKLVQLRVRSRVRVGEEDARALYSKFVKEFATEAPIELRALALRVYPGSTEVQIAERMQLAKGIVERAQKGEDFCKLVSEYTEDMETKGTCGSRGPQTLASLMPALEPVVAKLAPGQIAEPIRLGEVIAIIQLASREKLPAYEEIHDKLMQRATAEAVEKQRKLWLQEVKRSTYVDVRF
jgi:peptidyl-prolyl cis-trans isomerase SurA